VKQTSFLKDPVLDLEDKTAVLSTDVDTNAGTTSPETVFNHLVEVTFPEWRRTVSFNLQLSSS